MAVLLLALMAAQILHDAAVASTNADQCKLSDRQGFPSRLGWPRSEHRIPSTGVASILVVVADFSDNALEESPTEVTNRVVEPSKVHDFYQSVSYGRLDLKFTTYPRVVRSSIRFSDASPVSSPEQYKIAFDVINQIAGEIAAEAYDSVLVLANGAPKVFGAWASTTEQPWLFGDWRLYNPITAWTSIYDAADQGRLPSWKVIAHEIGHGLGFADLGTYVDPENYWREGTPGSFDLMGQEQGKATEMLAWNRWLMGWLDDVNIRCRTEVAARETFVIDHLGNGPRGLSAVVVKLSESQVLVVESRRGAKQDALGSHEGLLVYRVDVTDQARVQPIKIIARETALTMAPQSPTLLDVDRYLEATLNPGQFVRFGPLLIESVANDSSTDTFTILTGDAADQREQVLRSPKPAPTPTVTPAKRTITCVRDKKVKRVTAVAPKCPKGWRRR